MVISAQSNTRSLSDNRLNGARNLGILSTVKVSSGSVGPRDLVDFYKFTLKRSSNIKLLLSGLKANANQAFATLYLLNKAGKDLGQAERNSTNSTLLNPNHKLRAGTYYIQVVGVKSTKYKLTASIAGLTNTTLGSRTNPIDLGTLTSGVVKRSHDRAGTRAGTTDESTYYKFRLEQISNLTITHSKAVGISGVNKTIYIDSNRNGQFDSNDVPLSIDFGKLLVLNQPLTLLLPPTETYFLKVASQASPSYYDLSLNTSQVPGSLPTDPGSDAATAYDFGLLNAGRRFEAKDYVGPADSTDLYRFTLSSAANVTVTQQITGDPSASPVSIYQDPNGDGIQDVSYLAQAPQNLPAGTYYVAIATGRADGITYTLTLSA